ncbi:hypothetical protein PIB30_026007 [Stylosanthes scabra]|uniref:Pectinesterase inhibitor domain-containing protein n=1 Tax=Stylosanthes scabra TaxID=79078 RepID=A0ABU6VB59_9FABA|nr:hypothetical protein [Stylosanthes scabra]
MTNLKTITIFFFFLIAMTSLPSIIHCRTLNDDKLIESTCRRTPNYNVCIQSLKANPASSGADVNGLAQIMVKVMTSKANDAINLIHQLQRSGSSSQKTALSSCASKYNAILIGDIPQAAEALQKGDPKFAEDGSNDAANEATFCENEFNGKSPLTKQNNAMHDVSVVTAAIVRNLL